MLVWRGLDGWRAEAAAIRLGEGTLDATGTQIGVDPMPYRLDYELATSRDYLTRTLTATARGAGWDRRLELARADDGAWTANGEPVPDVEGALDCDIQSCPVTNAMPVLRDRLLDPGAEPHDYAMAWVSVPDLGIHRSEQRYEPIDGRRVRFVSLDSDFTAELELDEDGIVVSYPEMAERVVSSEPA